MQICHNAGSDKNVEQPFCPGKGCGAETSLIWAGHDFASRLETSSAFQQDPNDCGTAR